MIEDNVDDFKDIPYKGMESNTYTISNIEPAQTVLHMTFQILFL